MVERILVPLDEKDAIEAMVPVVAALAKGSGATVRFLRVSPIPRMRLGPYGRIVATVDGEMERIRTQASSQLKALEAQFDGLPIESVVRFGDPIDEILVEAEAFSADLIATSTPDTSRAVLRKAQTPMLVLTRDGAARRRRREDAGSS